MRKQMDAVFRHVFAVTETNWPLLYAPRTEESFSHDSPAGLYFYVFGHQTKNLILDENRPKEHAVGQGHSLYPREIHLHNEQHMTANVPEEGELEICLGRIEAPDNYIVEPRSPWAQSGTGADAHEELEKIKLLSYTGIYVMPGHYCVTTDDDPTRHCFDLENDGASCR